jgi:hypothetical protein
MKKISVTLILLLSSLNSFATIDANTSLFILGKDIQSAEYFVQKAPIIGCWGIAKGPELAQLTAPYEVNSLGCGSVSKENINALTCASLTSYTETEDFSGVKELTLDISKCDDKNNSDFINGVKKVVKLNFASKAVPNPKLNLVK